MVGQLVDVKISDLGKFKRDPSRLKIIRRGDRIGNTLTGSNASLTHC